MQTLLHNIMAFQGIVKNDEHFKKSVDKTFYHHIMNTDKSQIVSQFIQIIQWNEWKSE